MGLHEDVLLVAEAYVAANEPSWIIESTKTKRLRKMLANVCGAFHRAKATIDSLMAKDNADSADRIGIKQILARVRSRHCDDKANPPYVCADGEYHTGAKSATDLAIEVEAMIDSIVRFRDVLCRKQLEEREDYERKLGELRLLICVKDEGILDATARIQKHLDDLAASTGQPCGVCEDEKTRKCMTCGKPLCNKHNRPWRPGSANCENCEKQIPF